MNDPNAKLIEVKSSLSRKCLRLAKLAKSKGKRKLLIHHAESYRQQAVGLAGH
jgi:hypothetical protein